MMCNDGENCNNCKFRRGIAHLCITTCNVPQNSSKHPDYEKYKDLLYTENCPLKEGEEDNEFIYWF